MIADDIKLSVQKGLDLLPSSMDSINAKVMLYAIGLQESRFTFRYQILSGENGKLVRKGPARGFWQFESGGALPGLISLPQTKVHAKLVCDVLGIPFNTVSIWESLEVNDVLSSAFARLLLYSDPKPLPALSDVDAAWDYYVRCWRPGKPHRKTWNAFHAEAVQSADRRRATRD